MKFSVEEHGSAVTTTDKDGPGSVDSKTVGVFQFHSIMNNLPLKHQVKLCILMHIYP